MHVPRLLAEQHRAARRLRASVGEPPLKRSHLAAEQRARDARLRAHGAARWIAVGSQPPWHWAAASVT